MANSKLLTGVAIPLMFLSVALPLKAQTGANVLEDLVETQYILDAGSARMGIGNVFGRESLEVTDEDLKGDRLAIMDSKFFFYFPGAKDFNSLEVGNSSKNDIVRPKIINNIGIEERIYRTMLVQRRRALTFNPMTGKYDNFRTEAMFKSMIDQKVEVANVLVTTVGNQGVGTIYLPERHHSINFIDKPVTFTEDIPLEYEIHEDFFLFESYGDVRNPLRIRLLVQPDKIHIGNAEQYAGRNIGKKKPGFGLSQAFRFVYNAFTMKAEEWGGLGYEVSIPNYSSKIDSSVRIGLGVDYARTYNIDDHYPTDNLVRIIIQNANKDGYSLKECKIEINADSGLNFEKEVLELGEFKSGEQKYITIPINPKEAGMYSFKAIITGEVKGSFTILSTDEQRITVNKE